ncbi:hypothetical protein NC651_012768 [Populus alba x Populus x berolinensis]|nr:hypothetical protein NC651_012768 [Populus alba x Populus x berolinensis]
MEAILGHFNSVQGDQQSIIPNMVPCFTSLPQFSLVIHYGASGVWQLKNLSNIRLIHHRPAAGFSDILTVGLYG